MTLELESHHLARVPGYRGQLDLLYRRRAPRDCQPRGPCGEATRVELGAQRRGRTLGIHDERLDARAREDSDREAVAEQGHGQLDRPEVHLCRVRDKPAICKTLRVIGPPTTRAPRCCRSPRRPAAERLRSDARAPGPRRAPPPRCGTSASWSP